MQPIILCLLLLSACGAQVVGTMAGFGAATVLTPIASFFMPIKTAVAIVACFHLVGNAWRLWFFWRDIEWRLVMRFGLVAVVCSFGGAQAAAWLSASHVRMLLGTFLLVYALVELSRIASIRLPATTTSLVVGGTTSGLIAGIIGTGGAIRSVCLLAFGLPKNAYLGTSAMIALLVDASRLPVYLSQDFIPSSMWPLVLGLIGMAFVGTWIGRWLVQRVSAQRFKQFILVVLALAGLKLLADGWQGFP